MNMINDKHGLRVNHKLKGETLRRRENQQSNCFKMFNNEQGFNVKTNEGTFWSFEEQV